MDSRVEDTDAAATDLLYRQARTSILGAWFTAGLAVSLLWDAALSPFLPLWLLMYSALMGVRLYLCNQYSVRSNKTGEVVAWKRMFVVLAGCSGMLWGLLVFVVFPVISVESKVVVILFAGGLTASAIASYAAVLLASLAFSLPFLLSLMLVALPHPDKFSITISGMTFLYTLVLFLTAKTINRSVLCSITLQFENIDLIEHLNKLREAEESLNRELQDEIKVRRATQDELERSMQTLETAKIVAENANSAKDRFLAVISHEIRTPLNNIIMATECLEKSDINHNLRRYVDIVMAAGMSLLTIINDILDHARISSGQLQLERVGFDLLAFLQRTCAPFEVAAKSKGIGFYLNFSSKLPTVVILDSLRLKQVLSNLLDNAIKFTERGHVALVAGMETDSLGRQCLAFTVKDTGIGIGQDAQRVLFEPFVQADVSTTRRYGGTGLGLAICKDITELMHGSISIESVPGVGSEFSCSIPCETAEDGGTFGNQQCRQDCGLQQFPVSGLHILLAEDDETSRVLTTEILEHCGHQVKAVDNGEIALAEVTTHGYDLVLLDMEMPGIDGFKVISLVRTAEKTEGRPHQLIAAVTAQAFPEDRLRCLDAGADGYLAKPVTEEKLLCLIAAILQGRGNDTDLKHDNTKSQYDGNLLWQRTKGNRSAYTAVVAIFIRTYPQVVRNLQTALADNNLDEVRYAAHKLKGMLSLFDESDLHTMAQHLETAAKQGDLLTVSDLWPRLRHTSDCLYSTIQQTMETD